MKTYSLLAAAVLATTVLSANTCASGPDRTSGSTQAATESAAPAPNLQSATVLAFGPDNVLFVGDPKAGTIHAFATTAGKAAQSAYNLTGLDQKIAAFLGTTAPNILVQDLAVHPVSHEAYVAVARATGDAYQPAIVIINPAGEVRLFDTKASKATQVKVADAPTQEFKFWGKYPSRELTFTDLDFHAGKLYVSGLSTADFASTLRVIDYPFSGQSPRVSRIEIYHANHNEKETRAPIRALTIVPLHGQDYVLAAYTCTPLVLIPVSELKDGARVTGKTIAELGYGNTPLDLIAFTAQDMQQNKYPAVFLANRNQSAQVIGLGEVDAASQKPGLTTFAAFKRAGVPAFDVPMTGVLQVVEQDDYHLLAVRRNLETGQLELVSYMKNLYYRLSDFASEYGFPGYKYGEGQEFIKQVQNMQKQDEGFSNQVIK